MYNLPNIMFYLMLCFFSAACVSMFVFEAQRLNTSTHSESSKQVFSLKSVATLRVNDCQRKKE